MQRSGRFLFVLALSLLGAVPGSPVMTQAATFPQGEVLRRSGDALMAKPSPVNRESGHWLVAGPNSYHKASCCLNLSCSMESFR